MEGWFAINELHVRDKASVQSAPVRSAKDTAGRPDDPLYDGEFHPIHGRSSPNSLQTHDHCVSRETYTAGCNAVPEVCKLRLAYHLLR